MCLIAFDTIKIATAYRINGELTDQFPYALDEKIETVYTELPGWKTDLTNVRKKEHFPKELSGYIQFLEKELKVPIMFVSVGPDREQIIEMD